MSSHAPDLSVVIPSFNSEPYLRTTLGCDTLFVLPRGPVVHRRVLVGRTVVAM